MDIRKILLPVDGSEAAQRAALDAADLAKTFSAEVLLLHCNEVFPNLRQPDEYSREVVRQANATLGPSRDVLQDYGVAYMERVVDGSPAHEIPRLAGAEQCDLIVMGTRGTNPLEGLLLGSVTQRVLKTAPCRIFVVK